jgi:hypothetical protein
MIAERRLGDVHLDRSPTKVKLFGDGAEKRELAQFHLKTTYCS